MDTDKFLKEIGENCYIVCQTIEERRLVTNMLLTLGFQHGDSGYSKMYVDPWCKDTSYMHPFISFGKIEYGLFQPPNAICFSDFDSMFHPIDVNDLI